MGGKASPPPPPDYTPFAQASQQTAAADAHAADLQFQLGQDELAAQKQYADAASARGDAYYNLANQAQQWGKDQYNQIWPYAQDYLQSQDALNKLTGQYTSQEMDIAKQQADEAKQTYDRYMSTFVPIENQFAKTAQDYNTPARAEQASAGAQADVAGSFAGAAAQLDQGLKSYGIDPTQGRYAGTSAILASSKAAAMAAAGTQARRQNELTGLGLQQAAISVGQKLPTTSIAQITAGTQAGAAGLQAGTLGGGGIPAANQTLATGVNAIGSPTSYAYLSNPYTTLTGNFGSVGSSLFGGGTSALGNASGAINAGINATNTGFSNAFQDFQAENQIQSSIWGGAGKAIGGLGSFALSPLPAGGFGNTVLGAALAGSDRRLKEDITPIGTADNGLPLYWFRFKGTDQYAMGVMADEVEQIHPDAVYYHPSGFKMVDYSRALQA